MTRLTRFHSVPVQSPPNRKLPILVYYSSSTSKPPEKAFVPPKDFRAGLGPRFAAPALSSALGPPPIHISFIPKPLFPKLDLQIASAESLHWIQTGEVSMRLGGAVSPGKNPETPAPPAFLK